MNQKGFVNVFVVVSCIVGIVVIVAGILFYKNITSIQNIFPKDSVLRSILPVASPNNNPGATLKPSTKPITNVSPIGTSTNSYCTQDSECPSDYKCQALQGKGTACQVGVSTINNGVISTPESCQPTYKIIKGVCKLIEGGTCQNDSNCYPGLVCHANKCTNPNEGDCSGPNDNSCPSGYKCIQKCGPPVARIGDTPPGYYCKIEELADKPQNCPICLASNTFIDTPLGKVNVKDLKLGMAVWSVDSKGQKITSPVIKLSSTIVPSTHKVVHITLNDGRQLWVSPNHPDIYGNPIDRLNSGDFYDDSIIEQFEFIPYWDERTYDLLPDSATGFYFANGILVGSTLKR